MNNLPKVVTQQRRGRGSNPRLLDRKSDALPLSHRATKPIFVQRVLERVDAANILLRQIVCSNCLRAKSCISGVLHSLFLLAFAFFFY